jgi:hypothetical protein
LVTALGTIMAVAYVVAVLLIPKMSGQIVSGDAKQYFVQLRSLVFDRNLDLENEYTVNYGLRPNTGDSWWLFGDRTATGRVRSFAPIGPAFLWMPLYVAAVGVLTLLSWMGIVPAPHGFEPTLQVTPGLSGILASTAAVWFAWRTARRYTDDAAAVVAAVAVWLGSHALYYSLIAPAYPHSASMFAASFLVWYWLNPHSEPSLKRAFCLGAAAGACALMRWQDVVMAAVPALHIWSWRLSWRTTAAAWLTAAAGWTIAFSPQMFAWTYLYGQPFTLPQGSSFMQWTSPHMVDVLLSTNHGLFSWSPLLILASWGLVVFLGRHRVERSALLVVLIASWYINAAVADWWGGEAFGARRFLSLFPFFVVGLASWLSSAAHPGTLQLRRLTTTAVLVVMNGLLLLQYALFMRGFSAVAPYPNGFVDLWLTRFLVPGRLIAWWLG